MTFSAPDTKTQSILAAAWAGFSAYGFRKTSMDDIARGAGMSRPALYLHFKNKEAIFRALVESYYTEASMKITLALAEEVTLHQRLARAFAAHGGESMEAMMSSAHGMELLEATMNVAGDMIEEGEARLQALYAAWLTSEFARGQVVLTSDAETIGRLFCACLKGVKHTSQSYAAYQAGVASYAALCAEALTPAGTRPVNHS
ncbi:TetR/AcrR family transcriptional regulator [Pseudophaeobacter sp. EL27]|uniref:TetR/AcrR family transcriptional regulator n=1 Tax=Pseudophaeobacter sp. EL27 TaxID=2107580 RepID=UPI000EFAB85D|nr:TetR/AcrR family transcriptional regulator [Pseudophaeobacter sp. EL27]